MASGHYKLGQFNELKDRLGKVDRRQLTEAEVKKYAQLALAYGTKVQNHQMIVTSSVLLLEEAKSMTVLQGTSLYLPMKESFSKLNQKQKIELLEAFKDSNNLAVAHLAQIEADERYLAGDKSGAQDVIAWLKSEFSNNEEVQKFTKEFQLRLDNSSRISISDIGLVLPLSGEKGSFGQKALSGVDTGLKVLGLNENVKVHTKDSNDSPAQAAQAVLELIREEKVSFIIGGLFPESAKAEYLEARKYYKKHIGQFDVVIDEINTIPFMTPDFIKDGTPIVALIHQLAREFWFLETKFPINMLGYHYFEDRWLKKYLDIPTLTVSNSTKQDLIDLGFKDIFIIPEGLNIKPLDSLPEKEKDPTFIFVGRMGHAKRPDHVVKAFSYIREKRLDAKLWMVGDGAMRKQLEAMNPEGVTFFGYVSQEKKHKLMSRAHAILVPGVREGWGLVVTEANAMGTPAIGYNIHGLRDSIKDGETGLLCDPNPEGMAERAFEFMRDTDMQVRFSENALEWAREFDWTKSADEFLKTMELVI
jgi:glycosyltransferase involved in cell wall biosynthesis